MLSNPKMPRPDLLPAAHWPRAFGLSQLLSLVPAIGPRLVAGARVLQLEVDSGALLASLARSYPASRFIGLTEPAIGGSLADEPVKLASPNLQFRRVATFDLTRFRQVDLVLALSGLNQEVAIRAIRCTTRGGYFLLREESESAEAPMDPRFGGLYSSDTAHRPVAPGSPRPAPATRLLDMLFADVRLARFPDDPGYTWFVARVG